MTSETSTGRGAHPGNSPEGSTVSDRPPPRISSAVGAVSRRVPPIPRLRPAPRCSQEGSSGGVVAPYDGDPLSDPPFNGVCPSCIGRLRRDGDTAYCIRYGCGSWWARGASKRWARMGGA